MKHLRPLLIKFLVTALLLFFVLTLGITMPIGHVIVITTIYTLLSYFFIDLLALPRINNILTCLIDTTVAFFIIFIYSWTLSTLPLLGISIISAIGIGAGEWFFHKYLGMYVFIGELEDTAVTPTHANLQTEAAEEPDVHQLKNKDDDN
ncbi:DUF2512 family protein [Alkalihalobacterium alkalinitrilicum]|uniref:DUF2512 family protein n=1 Tax=Alkalihalobacterium alkalinitrilicum TaxID=427920 RepID=UPI000995C52A|nr:DUF2512 family protein [Alkalihalobacterium alkalinitrilicum]